MNTKDEDRKPKPGTDEEDTEGHGLLLDTDYYINRKIGREAELQREAREQRIIKESRPNKRQR